MDGSNSRADARDDLRDRRLPTPMLGAVAAAGAVSLGLVLIGSCGIGGEDTYVPPPPLNADLQAAPTYSSADRSGTTTPVVVIPPSPTWRVASDQPPRRTYTTPSATEGDEPPTDEPESTTRTTRPTTPRPTRTTRPRPTTTTERPTTTIETPEPTTERPTVEPEDDSGE
ncbi:hypothetical protein [Nocardia sp. NPDC050406]|uniref:hypothetical protein n=1 Tax=Nocardia sp. NPDC050406 TaxID=3364318 RepID=UPI00378E87D6